MKGIPLQGSPVSQVGWFKEKKEKKKTQAKKLYSLRKRATPKTTDKNYYPFYVKKKQNRHLLIYFPFLKQEKNKGLLFLTAAITKLKKRSEVDLYLLRWTEVLTAVPVPSFTCQQIHTYTGKHTHARSIASNEERRREIVNTDLMTWLVTDCRENTWEKINNSCCLMVHELESCG